MVVLSRTLCDVTKYEWENGNRKFAEMNMDVDPNQIFDNVKLWTILYFEVSNGKRNLNSDLLDIIIVQGVKSSRLINNGKVASKQLGWGLAGLYKVRPWL